MTAVSLPSPPVDSATLAGIGLAVGLLLDETIAIQENVVRHRELGAPAPGATRLGAAELRAGLRASALMIVAVLGALAVTGAAGDPALLRFGGMAAGLVLVLRLGLRRVAARLAGLATGFGPGPGVTGWLDRIADRYDEVLAAILDRRGIAAVLGIAALGLGAAGIAAADRTELAAAGGSPPIVVEVEGRDGSTLIGVAQRVADELRGIPGVAVDGIAARGMMVGSSDTLRWATIEVGSTGRPAVLVLRDARARLAASPPTPGHRVVIRGSAAERAAALGRLRLALLIGLGLGYLALARHLGSVVEPLAVLLAVPLAAGGAIGATVLTAGAVTPAGFAGALLGAGLAIRQGTLILTCLRRRRARGDGLRVALVEASRLRFRAIGATTGIVLLGAVGGALAGGGEPAAFAAAAGGGALAAAVATLGAVPGFAEILIEGVARVRARARRWRPAVDISG